MSNKVYVLRRKVNNFKPSPIPHTTYKPETFQHPIKYEPIKAEPHFESLAKSRTPPPQSVSVDPIPQYHSPPPSFGPVDFRVNAAELERDAYLIRKKAEKEALEKASEPTEFLKWQEKMRTLDELERKDIIQKRHEELDNSRKKAIKAKKKAIQERLELGNKMRLGISEELKQIQDEIEDERANIQYLKSQLRDLGPSSVQKVQKERREATKEMKKQLRAELKSAAKIHQEEQEKIKKQASLLREATKNHTMRHGDPFKEKIEITETTFLAALSDEETLDLLRTHKDEKKTIIEEAIERHRISKEQKMDKLVQMLDKVTLHRNVQEEGHNEKRKVKIEQQEIESERKQKEEDEKLLELEKRLEKKRNQRIHEAEQMEEHVREIQARNRYLAINKKALATKGFQSQQDAKLRSAKERQTSLMKEGTRVGTAKAKSTNELSSLKGLLGL